MAHLQQKAITDSVAAFFVFNEMLSGYDITTDSKSGMLFLRSTSRLFLQVFIMVFFSTKLLSTVELVCAYSMDCSVSQRIWIFLFLLLTIILNLRNIFSL